MSALGRATLAALALALGCRDPGPRARPLDATLFGERAQRVPAPGAEPRWWFDAETAPRIVAQSDLPKGAFLRWWSPTRTSTAALRRCDGASSCWTSEPPPPSWRGRAPAALPCAPHLGQQLQLELVDGSGRTRARWPVVLTSTPAARPEVRAVHALVAEGREAAALARARASMDPFACLEASRLLARKGETEAAADSLDVCAVRAEGCGLLTEQTRDLRAAAFYLYQARRYEDARARLARAEALDRARGHRPGVAAAAHYRGVIAHWTGDLRAAQDALRVAIEQSESLGDQRVLAGALGTSALTEVELGLRARAVQTAARAVEVAGLLGDPTYRAGLVHTRAWVRLEGVCSGARGAAQGACFGAVRRDLEAAREALVAGGDHDRAALATLDLALLEARAGRLDAARAAWAEVPTERLGAQAVFHTMLDAELLRRSGAIEAARAAAMRAAARAEAGIEQGPRFRAQAELARALAAVGDRRGAATAFTAALDRFERVVLDAPLGSGRAPFVRAHRGLYAEAAAAALEAGDLARAFDAAERAAARVLRDLEVRARLRQQPASARLALERRLDALRDEHESIEAARLDARLAVGAERDRARDALTARRAAWTQRLDEVVDALAERTPTKAASLRQTQSELRDEEILVSLLAPPAKTPDHGAIAFVITRGEVVVTRGRSGLLDALRARASKGARLLLVDPERLVARWAPRLGARPLRAVFATSELPYAGLVTQRRPRATGASTALVIADPSGDLPFARKEGEWVAHRWGSEGRALLGGEARRAPVLCALEGRSPGCDGQPASCERRLVHFAGHGVRSNEDPWAAHLSLAAGHRLSAEQVLLTRVCARVLVLSGCETAQPDALGPGGHLGLAGAFLVAGASSVVAFEPSVPDAEAFDVMTSLYAANLAEDPARAVQTVLQRATPELARAIDGVRVFGLVPQ